MSHNYFPFPPLIIPFSLHSNPLYHKKRRRETQYETIRPTKMTLAKWSIINQRRLSLDNRTCVSSNLLWDIFIHTIVCLIYLIQNRYVKHQLIKNELNNEEKKINLHVSSAKQYTQIGVFLNHSCISSKWKTDKLDEVLLIINLRLKWCRWTWFARSVSGNRI